MPGNKQTLLVQGIDRITRALERIAAQLKVLPESRDDAHALIKVVHALETDVATIREKLAALEPAESKERTRQLEALSTEVESLDERAARLVKDASRLAKMVRSEPTDRTPGGDERLYHVALRRASTKSTSDQGLWPAIRNRTLAIGFGPYKAFIDQVMCYEGFPKAGDAKGSMVGEPSGVTMRLPFLRADAYARLKVATELFLMQECGLRIDEHQHWDFSEPADPDYPFALKDPAAADPDDRPRRIFDHDEETLRLGRESPSPQDMMDALRNEYLIQLGAEQPMLPYFALIREKLKELPLKASDAVPANCYGILRSQLTGPCFLELIWSFWHEAGFLSRSMHVVNRRFQNIRAGERDPLTRFDVDTLRPMNNLLWGYIQDEQHRLTVQRRVYEYDHHYGLRLHNRSTSAMQPVDTRSKFIEGFHNLLYLTSIFYKEDDDTTVIADAFRVLNGLREVHLLLAEGAHNQFGDLPWTARAEMMIEQWLLARPEMREFLGGRIAVPYAEPWMDRVDTMKTLQGWNDVSITHFHDLAVCGEQILLSVRYGNWSQVNLAPQAANWARYWRPEIQRYIHAYQAATGVDLAVEPVDTTSPAELLRQRALARVR